MDFEGYEDRQIGFRTESVPVFKYFKHEILNARLGFESVGSNILSERVRDENGYHQTLSRARLIVSGNVALIGSLRDVGLHMPETSSVLELAQQTVESGLVALSQASSEGASLKVSRSN